MQHSREVVSYARGLALTHKVLGSLFGVEGKKEWESVVLIRKSLIRIGDENELMMHDQL